MTICVSVKVGEGLVLAADSMVTLTGAVGNQQGILQTFEYANKLTQFKDYPVGVMSWGAAAIGQRSIQSLIMEYEHGLQPIAQNANYTVKAFVDGLAAFVQQRYDQAFPPTGANRPTLGIYVGGYSAGNFFSDAYVLHLPGDPAANPPSPTIERKRPPQPNGMPTFGADWYGQTKALTRLIKGYDPEALQELVNRGAPLNVVQQWVQDSVGECPLIFDGMPIHDAVDFAKYATGLTIGWFRFGIGAPLCGGDVDIAVVTPTRVRWAQRKQWTIRGDSA